MTRNLPLLAAVLLFLATTLAMPHAAPLFTWLYPGTNPPIYDRTTILALAASHLLLVVTALAISATLGIGAAILVTRPAGRDWRGLVDTVATIGQTFPPAAVLAILVPVLGFGDRPTLVALALYGLLPITENTLAGLAATPAAILEAAAGTGLSPGQILRRVELPLALPLILAGLRTAAVIGLGTATIGSTIGAATLGTPIIDGLVANKPGFVLQGAVPLALLAICVELLFDRFPQGRERLGGRHAQRAGARRPPRPLH